MSLILRQAKGSKLTIAEMDGNLSYLEQLATSNSGGNYEQTVGSQTTILAGDTGTVVGVTITVGDGPVMVSVTGDANPNTAAGAWVKLQLFRDKGTPGETALGHAIQAESSDSNENVPYALSFIDEPGAGTYTYTLEVIASAASDFQFGEVDGPVIYAVELKQGVFSEAGNSVVDSCNANAKGGCNNGIYDNSNNSTIIGGGNNYMSDTEFSSIIGGCCNRIYGSGNNYISIIGGCCNTICDADYTSIIGGYCNTICGESDYSGIFSSSCSYIDYSQYSSITGGHRGTISDYSYYSSIVGGCRNEIEYYSCCSSILGGERNCLSSSGNSTVIGGCRNKICNSDCSTAIGGACNTICDSDNSAIIASRSDSSAYYNYFGNLIRNSNSATILGHCSVNAAYICSSSNSTIIGGRGYSSYICYSDNSAIIGGYDNYVCSSSANTIIAAYYSGIYCSSDYSSIIGGGNHCIHDYSCNSSILGGRDNEICVYSCNSNIIGGCNNNLFCCSSQSVIVGGSDNSLCCSCNSAIIGGSCLTLESKNNTTLFCCLGTNYGGTNFFGVTSSNVSIAGTNLCIRNGLIVGIS